jgi:hypothetical protein
VSDAHHVAAFVLIVIPISVIAPLGAGMPIDAIDAGCFGRWVSGGGRVVGTVGAAGDTDRAHQRERDHQSLQR